MRINKEGYRIIIYTAVCGAILTTAGCLLFPYWAAAIIGILSLAAVIFCLLFFREPHRPLHNDPAIVYAPADGRIVVVEKVEETEYLRQEMVQISVFMSLGNVHVNWYPVGGRIEYVKYHPGKFLVAWHPKSSELNERTTVVVDCGGAKVLFRQIAGYIARRIVSYAREGEQAAQNDICGFIKFGSRVDVLVPADSEILVGMDQRVVGSQTPLARLK